MVAWFTWYARNILLLIHNRNHLSLYTHTVMRFVVSSKCPIVCSGTTLVQLRGRDAIFQRSVRYAKTKLNCLRLGFQQLVLVNENVAFLSVCLRRTTGRSIRHLDHLLRLGQLPGRPRYRVSDCVPCEFGYQRRDRAYSQLPLPSAGDLGVDGDCCQGLGSASASSCASAFLFFPLFLMLWLPNFAQGCAPGLSCRLSLAPTAHCRCCSNRIHNLSLWRRFRKLQW